MPESAASTDGPALIGVRLVAGPGESGEAGRQQNEAAHVNDIEYASTNGGHRENLVEDRRAGVGSHRRSHDSTRVDGWTNNRPHR
jgi:hypothetical protein